MIRSWLSKMAIQELPSSTSRLKLRIMARTKSQNSTRSQRRRLRRILEKILHKRMNLWTLIESRQTIMTMTKNLRNLNKVRTRAPPRTTSTTTYPSNTSPPADQQLLWAIWLSWPNRDLPFIVFMMTKWRMLKLSRFGTMILEQIQK